MTNNTQFESSSLSATNFDLSSLYILKNEISVVLKTAEVHLSEFNDNKIQAPLLLDSADVLEQMARILDLLSLDGASDLTDAIAKIFQLLHDNVDKDNDNIVLDVSEAIMVLERYIEFVLLRETLEPLLLVDIINRLHKYLNKPELTINSFGNRKTSSLSIFDPQANYQPLTDLDLDVKRLLTAYRVGLNVALTATSRATSAEDRKKLKAMQIACETISAQSKCLFWQSATASVTDIDKALPLTEVEKSTLIFLEQQFLNYCSVSDKRFADLVNFACHRNNNLSQDIKQAYAKNRLNKEQQENIKTMLFGPSYQMTDVLNTLIQEEISQIKDSVDSLSQEEGDADVDKETTIKSIADRLQALGSSLKLLKLDEASSAMYKEAKIVSEWQSASAENIDTLLVALVVAENASITLLKSYTPGTLAFPLHNSNISLHQLDTSYESIIAESRKSILTIEQKLGDYLQDESHDAEYLSVIPQLLHEVAGALNFLNLDIETKMVNRLIKHINNDLIDGAFDTDKLSHVADVISAVEYRLEGLESNQPVGNQAINIGYGSLKALVA